MNKSLYFFILLFMFSITSCGVFQKEEEEKKIETHSTDFNFVQIILDWFPNANHAGLFFDPWRCYHDWIAGDLLDGQPGRTAKTNGSPESSRITG